MIVYLYRPIPGHGYFFGHQAQPPLVTMPDPEGRVFRKGVTLPGATFFFPTVFRKVAICLNEFEEFLIAHQVLAGLKSWNFRYMSAIFIVPPIERIRLALAYIHNARRHVD